MRDLYGPYEQGDIGNRPYQPRHVQTQSNPALAALLVAAGVLLLVFLVLVVVVVATQ